MTNTYFPILKTKRGEMFAVSKLLKESVNKVFPIFEITNPNVDWNDDALSFKKSLSEHALDTIGSLISFRNQDFALDFSINQYDAALLNSTVPKINELLNDISWCPCLNVFNTPEIIEFYKQLDFDSAILRVNVDEVEDEEELPNIIGMLIEQLGLRVGQFDVLLDFKSIEKAKITRIKREAKIFIPELLPVKPNRILLAASSFPDSHSISSCPRNQITKFERTEFELWKSLSSKFQEINICFSDYATTGISIVEIDPKLMTLGAKVKYTDTYYWLLFKGESIKTGGYEKFRELSEQIVASEYYRGKDFSWADEKIYSVAQGEDGTGNQETWVRVAVNQHLELVVKQLSS